MHACMHVCMHACVHVDLQHEGEHATRADATRVVGHNVTQAARVGRDWPCVGPVCVGVRELGGGDRDDEELHRNEEIADVRPIGHLARVRGER